MAFRESPQGFWQHWGILLLALATACLPMLLGPWMLGGAPHPGTSFQAGLISDDGAALGYVHRVGPLADWLGSEYDLRTVRFWRPLTTTSLGIQEALTGSSAAPLRLFNLAGHALSAVLVVAILLQLGIPRFGALAAGILVGLYPHQGGNVVWPVGRVDAQCVPLILTSLWFVLRGSWAASALAVFCAMATKELAVVTPILAVGLVWAAPGDSPEGATRRRRALLAMGGTVALALLWRRLALGVWVGGYPNLELRPLGWMEKALEFSSQLPGAAAALIVALPTAAILWGMALVLLVLRARGARSPDAADGEARAVRWAAALPILGLAAAAPLHHLLAEGRVPAEHLRTLFLVDAIVVSMACCSLGSRCMQGNSGRAVRAVLVIGLVGLAGHRFVQASSDVLRWSDAGDLAEAEVQRARAALASLGDLESSDLPVFLKDPTRVKDGAYVLHWGVADRFREPFARTARPVWPWRPLFDLPGAARAALLLDERGLLWPRGSDSPPSPALEIQVRHEASGMWSEAIGLPITPSLASEPGALLRVQLSGSSAEGAIEGRFEVLLITELGYGVAGLDADTSMPLEISLRDLFLRTSAPDAGIALWQVLAQAADAGARCGYLEFRFVPRDPRGPVRAGRWIELTWPVEVRDVLLPKDAFGI